jgi:hypothetical protein
METSNVKKWMLITLLNLVVVAFIGVLMRYKIGFEFPFFNQKFLQHAHSHFAFSGWVSQALMILMLLVLKGRLSALRWKHYNLILWINIVCAYGMLLAFSIQGYGVYSIIFSSLSILVFFVFSYFYIIDLKAARDLRGREWFIAALLFGIISSLGTFALIYMMVTNNIPQHEYLASIYWFLHFQYNGWFFFAGMGLFVNHCVYSWNSPPMPRRIFWLFALSCIPAYGLSVLWLDLSVYLIIIIALAAIAQVWGWILILRFWMRFKPGQSYSLVPITRMLLTFVAIAISVKYALQMGSVFPPVSDLAFSFRPIVIAYLHLVLLAITSVYIVCHAFTTGLFSSNRLALGGVLIFAIGVLLNEIALAAQGIFSVFYIIIPHINTILFAIAVLLFISLLSIVISQLQTKGKIVLIHDSDHNI